MRFTFPHFTPKPEFIQPDYQKWIAIKFGMSRDEVLTHLGQPINDKYRGGKWRREDAYYCYGYLQMPMIPHPRDFSFLIGFDDHGKVFSKIDPFGGRFSTSGAPSIPEIIVPIENSTFLHFPRILDCRWLPCSGVYPMSYDFELGIGYPTAPGEIPSQYGSEWLETNLQIPFFMTSFGGAQPGRFRIKAKNELGESDWSEYRYFEFLV